MIWAAELINENGISTIALAFFTALFAGVGTTVVGIYQIKAKANEAKDAALSAQEKATETATNTQNVANGFASRVDRKLDNITSNQEELAREFREHLQWHVEKGS